jgi:hypothetical protein
LRGTYLITVNGTALGFILHRVTVTVGVGGTVCLADPSTATGCSGPAGVFNGPLTNPATQLKVGVFIDNSDLFNSFDITLKADHSVLAPFDADLTGSIIPTPQIFWMCIGRVAKAGPACPPTDTPDTIHLNLVTGNYFTSIPATGLLFTAVYNITGTTSNTSILFQTGCSNTSIPGVCVAISLAGSIGNDPEVIGNIGSFANGNPSFVTLTSSPNIIGPIYRYSGGSANITAIAQNGWPGFSADIITFTMKQSAGLVAQIPQGSCTTGGVACSVTLQASSLNPGNYFVTLFATYSYFNPNTSFTSTLAATLTLQVIVTDFSVSANPTMLNIQQGASAPTTLTLGSLNGFTGTIGLSGPTITGIAYSFAPGTVTLTAGSSGTSTFTVTVNSGFAIGNYSIIVTATTGSLSHTIRVTVQVSNFGFSESANTLLVPVGGSGSVTVTATSVNGYNAPVNLIVNSGVPACVSYSYSPNPIQLPARELGTSTLTFAAASTCASSSSLVSIQANSGTWGRGLSLYLNITDFSLIANPSSLNTQAGTYGNSTLTISPLTGFRGLVSLTTTVSPTGLYCAIGSASITLGLAQSSSLSCYGPAGNYTVNVTASSGTMVHSVTVLYQIVDFSIAAPGSITCVQGARSCSYTVTIGSVNGFTGTVSLTIIGRPSGATITLSSTSVILSSGGTATVTVRITPPSSGTVTVQGSSGNLIHSVPTHLTLVT